eukprot:5239798-Prymnesium_polylepis.1
MRLCRVRAVRGGRPAGQRQVVCALAALPAAAPRAIGRPSSGRVRRDRPRPLHPAAPRQRQHVARARQLLQPPALCDERRAAQARARGARGDRHRGRSCGLTISRVVRGGLPLR